MKFKAITLLPLVVAALVVCAPTSDAKLVKKRAILTAESSATCPSNLAMKNEFTALCNRMSNCPGYNKFKPLCKKALHSSKSGEDEPDEDEPDEDEPDEDEPDEDEPDED